MFVYSLSYYLLSTGTEFKCTACPVSGIMLFLEIQRGKDGMKNQRLNNILGATAGCTVRMFEGSIGTQDANVGHGIKGDAWFGSVRAAAALGFRGHQAVMQLKTNRFPKKFIADMLDGMPGGVKIVLKGTDRYNTKTSLFFVTTEDAGNMMLGNPYIMKYTDDYGNLCT